MDKTLDLDSMNRLPEPFVHALLKCQDRLYVYLTTLLRNEAEVEEVLQDTNLTLCRRSGDFLEIKDFTGWACRVAYHCVLSFRKQCARDRHVFDDEVLDLIAQESQKQLHGAPQEQAALQRCFEKLSPRQQIIAQKRYQKNGSVQKIAEELGRSPNAISQALCRIRASLLECIQKNLASESR